MPQLDLMTFFSQFFWFSLSFFMFYFFFLHYIIPIIVINLKLRKKILISLAQDANQKKENVFGIANTYDNILNKTLSFFRIYLYKVLNSYNLWLLSNLSRTNLEYFTKANIRFFKILVERNFSLTILYKRLKTSKNPTYWSKIWSKCKKISKL